MPDDTIDPISTLNDCFGQAVPIYGLTYDKHGICTSPQTRDHVIDLVDAQGFTDVILYSHGWNNEYPVARERYEVFLRGLSDTDAAHSTGLKAGFKPLFVGVFWPSTILVWPSDQTPDIAATPNGDTSDPMLEGATLADTLSLLPPALAELLQDRLDADRNLTDAEAAQVAAALAQALPRNDDDEPTEPDDDDAVQGEDIVAAWKRLAGKDKKPATTGSADDFGMGDDEATADAEVAGLFGFDPRIILRSATMWQMKDRAGVVGVNGVADTLGRLLSGSQARVHLVGHSYGCKVVTTALVIAPAPRKVHSLTLLQPAINHLAFAPEARPGQPGAFRAAFDRLENPVLSTFTWRDIPLYRMFHLAARRKKDIGELQFAATKISRYYALGGYGPLIYEPGEVMGLRLPRAGHPYPVAPPSVRMIGLDGAEGITGHPDVNTPYTFWAMLQQLR